MARYDRRIDIRVSSMQEDMLKEKARQCGYGTRMFSSFLRDSILECNGMQSEAMKKSLHQLRWEMNKIGTNINQATKRINAGYGYKEDITELLANQNMLKLLLEEYINSVEKKWK